ncbi:hypothetical protein A33Q_1498 [Indibacter alkaliphilus LW1]|uniref:Uncharacterized protein n=1 Tax=Indibacter alkaliphilus (strain CCUG 57479 / KCTC 22604 / LW1) TaxID=1189612 RepID=S2E0M2_INDAL|nr:hypothetical protein [Indibacter alkaliphilus]EOZ97991.1 hypothetical protein A33Q_1498 [Indibacter alkaliphilus LW1]
MKKLKLLCGILFLAIAGCQDIEEDNFLDLDLNPVSVVNETLKFQSVEDYESFLGSTEDFEIPEFSSFRMNIDWEFILNSEILRLSNSEYRIKEFEDSKLLDILDKDGFIIIGEYLIYLNFDEEKAYVTKNLTLKDQISQKELSNEEILIFDFDEDVLEILFESSYNPIEVESSNGEVTAMDDPNARILASCPGLYPIGSPFPPMIGDGCDDRKCEWTTIYPEGDYTFKAEAMHAYQAAAIYFRLKSEVSQYRRLHQNPYVAHGDSPMTITYWGTLTPRNRQTETRSGCWDSCQGCWPPPANTQKIQKVHYEAGRRLTQYNLYGIFDVFLGGGNYGSGYLDVFQLENRN